MRKQKKQRIVYLIVLMLIITACSKNEVATERILKGDFKKSIIETGELEAVVMKGFNMPRFRRDWYFDVKIVAMKDHGARLSAGDTIIELDPAEFQKRILDRETDLANQKAALRKLMVQQEIRRNGNQATLENEEASFELKKLELESYKFESETARKIKELEFEQAKIRLNKTKSRIELNEVVEKNDLLIQKIKVEQVESSVQSGYEILPQLKITTPIPGIFQRARKHRSSDRVDIGDEVHPGRKMADVPDLTWMKVNTVVNETDISKIYMRQKVLIRLDAFPKIPFEGEISFIGKLCHEYDRESTQKVFDIGVKCLTSDERLKPGMTVSCEIICADLKDVIYIPNSCLQKSNKKHYVYLKEGAKIVKTEVEIGEQNNHFTVLKGDYKAGMKVVPVKLMLESKEL